MAENESLDLACKTSRRWFHLLDRICGGASDDELVETIHRNIVKTWQNIQKQIPLGDLIDAAVHCHDMTPIVRACDGHDYAELLHLEARPFDNAEDFMERCVRGGVERFVHQMKMRTIGTMPGNEYRGFCDRLNGLMDQSSRAFRSLAQRIVNDPNTPVRMPRRSAAAQAASEPQQMARMSLVGFARRTQS